jgi:hypothetical protein
VGSVVAHTDRAAVAMVGGWELSKVGGNVEKAAAES